MLLSSGNKAAMLRLVPWMEGPHTLAVQASLSRWEPADRRAQRLRAAHDFPTEDSTTQDSTTDQDGGGVVMTKTAPPGRNPLLPPVA